MLKELLKEVTDRIKRFSSVNIISRNIDEKTQYPCIKIDIVDQRKKLINKYSLDHFVILSINYFPKPMTDSRIELLEMQDLLSNVFLFDFEKWSTNEVRIDNYDEFVSCLVEFSRRAIFEEELELGKGLNGIGFKEYEDIENIEIKTENEE